MKRFLYPLFSLTLMILLLTACKGDKGDPGIPGPAGAQNDSTALLFDVGEVQVVLRDAYYADSTPVGGTPDPDTLLVKYHFGKPFLELKPSEPGYPLGIDIDLIDSTLLNNVRMYMEFLQGASLESITEEEVQSLNIEVTHDIKTQGKVKRWQGNVYFFPGGQNLTINKLAYDAATEMLSFEITLTFDQVASDPQGLNSKNTSAVVSGKVHVLEVVYRP
ncbi:MAG: hypothetical protein KatS3mg033_1419 [Thermonema sp.]|uniref:hypothetical protein n=1 Tax=Thermonema sp. TaxID=2231181 RepID=UPI0021DF4073|nr:hypothetical protein [Thermonema sp.]GIV39619.1 MAG: hypothetical protein KatS3mg033_1419 [Thermonema sp.]